MTSDQWDKLNRLFEAVLERDPDERDAFIKQICGTDEALRLELEALLAAHDEAGEFMETPAVGLVAETIVAQRNRKFSKGQTVGHYKIISEIGEGGQGAVFQALDTKLGRTVALKLLPADMNVDPVSRVRFEREAQLASSLDHPNICTVHDLTEIDGSRFIVMQYVGGHNVRDLLKGRPLELSSAIRIAIQVCDGLAAAHARGIIHRDIKAHNVVVTENGQAKILDFGLAKLTSGRSGKEEQTELTNLGSPYGTPTYAAPEQSRGDRVDHRADIFSAGVLLYEMLTGVWPFQGKTAIDVRHAVLHSQPPPLAEKRGAAIPVGLQTIVDRALAKDPRDRYQEIVEMRDDLLGVLHELPDGGASETARFTERFKSVKPRHVARWSGPAVLIAAAVALSIVAFAAIIIYRRTPPAGPGTNTTVAIRSIAVLPFKPLTANSDPYLELGMADALITRLSNVSQIVVRPTSAVLKYTASQEPVAAGRELNVDAVLDGRIQREGDKLRVTVQLIRVNNGEVLWFGKFDEDFKGIFAVQDSISERLIAELAMKLSEAERQLITKRYTENTLAYQAYLRGRYHWNKWSRQNLNKAIESFQEALKEDPSYAPAHAGLADCYELQGYLNLVQPKEAYPKAQTEIMKALAIDNNLGEAHLVLAKIKLLYDWDLKTARQEIDIALTLISTDSDAHGFSGTYFIITGDLDRALAERKRAQELDPVNAFSTLGVAWAYEYQHDFDNAIAHINKAIELDPNFAVAYEALGNQYARKGLYAKAVETYLKARNLTGVPPYKINALRQAFETAGIKGYWEKELEFTRERVKQKTGSSHRMAFLYAQLADKDQAFFWLDQAFAERSSGLIFLKTNPAFDSLHSDRRFQDLLRRIGLVS